MTAGDLGHLHHLLLAFGHSHRRAVLVLYYWSGVIAFGSVAPAFLAWERLLPWLVVAGALGIVLTALGTRPEGEPRHAEVPTTGSATAVERTGTDRF